MSRFRYIVISIAAILIFCGLILTAAESRFPPPEFESGHEFPQTTTPQSRDGVFTNTSIRLFFLGTLGLATYLALKKRSRKAIFGLTVFSLLYFGFYRRRLYLPDRLDSKCHHARFSIPYMQSR